MASPQGRRDLLSRSGIATDGGTTTGTVWPVGFVSLGQFESAEARDRAGLRPRKALGAEMLE